MSHLIENGMKRKLYESLLKWKQEEQGRIALLIEGARRVGKSWLVKNFAEQEYRSYIMVDFTQLSPELKEVFDHYLTMPDRFFLYLQTVTGKRLYERESVIVFDEVQFYPKVREAIKHLVADGRYDYLETGSLVGIKKHTKDILIPSEERHIEMLPMDFEEFLWAQGDELTMPFIRDCFARRTPLGPMHRKAMDLFRQYLIVGGMPQAVKAFAEGKDFVQVDRVKRDILSLYRNDIQHYTDELVDKVTNIWDTLPVQLQKHEKKFRLSALKDEARFRTYETSFFWLKEADVVNICYGATEPSIGLRMKQDGSTLKLYMADTGLLISHAFSEKQIMGEELYKKLLLGKLEVNEGMLVENIVAQMLRAAGHQLYFFSSYSKQDAADTMEIDFLIAKPVITSRHNISPVEVKSSAGYRLSSLRKFITKYGEQLSAPYVLHSGDVKAEDGIVFLPLYMTPCL
jgi:predicted AAA+ superfamily ATPase